MRIETSPDDLVALGPLPGNRRWYKMVVAYDGSAYSGWQVQPGRSTIQSMLELAINEICHEHVRVTGSGRTDTGVHAIGQVASFSLATWRANADDLCRALNSKLPSDISIRRVDDAPVDFHAIRDATGKRYRYQIQVGGTRDAFEYCYRWHLQGPINLDAIYEASRCLVGKHDFSSFQAAGAVRKSSVRDVRELAIINQSSLRQAACVESGQGRGVASDGLDIAIEIEADGFLYNMVRNIVGTLIEVGRGRHSPSWVGEVLAAADRTKAGPTAPAHGLFLLRVDYDH